MPEKRKSPPPTRINHCSPLPLWPHPTGAVGPNVEVKGGKKKSTGKRNEIGASRRWMVQCRQQWGCILCNTPGVLLKHLKEGWFLFGYFFGGWGGCDT